MNTSTIFLVLALAIAACSGTANRDQYAGTTDATTELMRQDPNEPEEYYARAVQYAERGSYVDALADIKSALEVDSLNETYLHLKAEMLLANYDSQAALATLNTVHDLYPASLTSALKLAELQIILRLYPQATSSLRRALEIDPNNLDALSYLGILYRDQGDYENAARTFQTIVEADGNNIEAWTMLGNIYDMMDHHLAMQCFENSLLIDSTYVRAWHSKAFYLQNHDEMDEAIAIYEKIHRLDASYADAYLNCAILHIEQQNYPRARQEITKFCELSPTNPFGPFYQGVILEAEGDIEGAVGFYNQASSLSPRSVRFAEAVEHARAKLD